MESEKCRYREIRRTKKEKEGVPGRGAGGGPQFTREVRQWFSKGPIDRYVRSSSVGLLSPSNQSLHHRVSLVFALFLVSPRGERRSSPFVKAASRHALGD